MIAMPLALMGASFMVIATIILRRFSQLSLLDVENIPQVKEGKKKEEFLKKKIEKKVTEMQKNRKAQWKPILQQFKNIQLAFRRYVGKVERMLVREKLRGRQVGVVANTPQVDVETTVRGLLNDAVFSLQEGDVEAAEKKYIAAIRIAPKEKDAYLGLGDVYRKQGQIEEAKETYRFVIQLDPSGDQAHVRLAELAEEIGNTEEAVQEYEQAVLLNDNISSRFSKLAELLASLGQYDTAREAILQAVELEPENPKYLDMATEISILSGNKLAAEGVYQRLRMVNPENQKLPALKDKIEKMN